MAKIRVAQAYTGNVGSEIIRRLTDHPQMELVGVLVHAADKAGQDSGSLVGGPANGIITTRALDEILALKPDGVIWSGALFDAPAYARVLEAGINLYTGMGGYYLKGQPEEPLLAAAAERGKASFCAGGNIPGLISDVLPLFVSGYTGRIRQIRAWQRNQVDGNPSATQLRDYLGIGLPPGGGPYLERISAGWTYAMTQSARMIADALKVEFESLVLERVDYAVAPERAILPASGLVIEKGMVAGARWSLLGRANGREFYRVTNEQTALLALGEGWRQTNDEPAWHVEIDGDPSIVCNFGWPAGTNPGHANTLLNAARAMNVMPRLVASKPGLLTVMDFPAPVASDGLMRL